VVEVSGVQRGACIALTSKATWKCVPSAATIIGRRAARLAMLLDGEGQHEIGAHITPLDPLKFKDSKKYPDRLKEAQAGTSKPMHWW